jgi:hypothetical protein
MNFSFDPVPLRRELDCPCCAKATYHERSHDGWKCVHCGAVNEPREHENLAEAELQRRDNRGGTRLVLTENPASEHAAYEHPASAKPEDLRGDALERCDCDPAVARAVYEHAGLAFEPGLAQVWQVGEHQLTVSLWVDPKRRHVTHLVSGWPPEIRRNTTKSIPTDLALAELYAISFSRVLFLPRGPEMARWKRRLLRELGRVQTNPVDLRPLPVGAPDSAVTTWRVIKDLLEIRALTEPSDQLPLSSPFLSRWTRTDEDVFRRGKYRLEKQGLIRRADEAPSRGGGRPTVVWHVALQGGRRADRSARP